MIRQLSRNEIPHALALAWEVFREFEAPDYSEEGVKTFRDFLDDGPQIGALTFYGAFAENRLVGLLAMRGDGHICLFFVRAAFHRQGFGRRLFEFALRSSGAERITVHSSPYAVEIYRKLGFSDLSPEQTRDGIRFTPMAFERKRPYRD